MEVCLVDILGVRKVKSESKTYSTVGDLLLHQPSGTEYHNCSVHSLQCPTLWYGNVAKVLVLLWGIDVNRLL